MLDFVTVKSRDVKEGIEVYPDFQVRRSEDLMIRGGEFYAVWVQSIGMWSQDEYVVQLLVDAELSSLADKLAAKSSRPIHVKYMRSYLSSSWSMFQSYVGRLADNSQQLDNRIIFANTEVIKKDYISHKLSYPIEHGDTPAFDALFETLYDEENLSKIKWAIGAIIDGGSKDIQKFLVFFGDPGTGKSTTLNLVQQLFPGYYTTFEAKTLIRGGNGFAMEAFRANPLIAINHDGDLSRVGDNSLLNSVASHDPMTMNVKYQSPYTIRLNAMLLIATNKPVDITDAKSGLIRRLIDIRPTGNRVSGVDYDRYISQIEFELGAIAEKCLGIYHELGKNYYKHYKPIDMMRRTNVFFNFVDEYYFTFLKEDIVTLTVAWKMYKQFCDDAGIEYRLPLHRFRDEFANYWQTLHETKRIEGRQYRSVFEGFLTSKFEVVAKPKITTPVKDPAWVVMTKQPSILDRVFADQPAQTPKRDGKPRFYWADVVTTVSDMKTTNIHYVIPVSNHVVVDLDLKDENGDKSLELNLAAAEKFPPTYAEISRGGAGIHLHYDYDGDVTKLSRVYAPNIDVLVAKDNFSIRRKLSRCNGLEIATINSGLPIKIQGEKMVKASTIKTERTLRMLLMRNIHKEIHAATKPSVDFMYLVLTEAYASGLVFDVSDLKGEILNFASNSTNNAQYCILRAQSMPYESEADTERDLPIPEAEDERLVFFDVEVFPNLLLVCWKFQGKGMPIYRMFNPSPMMLDGLLKLRLVGFNNRGYDNHILYAAYLGFNNKQIYNLSQRIIDNDRSAKFREAYGLSYTDIFDYSIKKQSLKKWQLELKIFHKELDMPWNEPVPEALWPLVAEYCDNDVISTEAVHDHLHVDFGARQILAKISGLTVNDSSRVHSTRIIFGKERNPQKVFNYPDLSEMFPGYTFDPYKTTPVIKVFEDEAYVVTKETTKRGGVSTYRGIVAGEGGYVFAKPGIYHNVAYLDVASMHPTSIQEMNLFGPYTKRYTGMKDVRMAVKDGELSAAREMYDGELAEFLQHPEDAAKLSVALKLPLNSVYGYTCARFDNPFKDPRNVDNVVAKRGALFMIDLKFALEERGYNAVHFKTDSVKIADCTQEVIDFVIEFGKKYGYTFNVEGWFEKMALINDAVLIAKWQDGPWYAVGARFAKPYVFKSLFTKEPIELEDMVEARSVKNAAIYLEIDGEREFVGKVGAFMPIKPGHGGGTMLRVTDEKEGAVSGSKGFKWLPAAMVRDMKLMDSIDESYFAKQVDEAIDEINKWGDSTLFLD